MSKAVLISIQPKWCELIASGKKTVEVRKTRPKLDTPFKVYIYCTKAKEFFSIGGGMYAAADELYRLPTGEIKLGDSFELAADWSGKYDKDDFLNGKVIGEFVCDRIFAADCDCVAPFDKNTKAYIDKESCISKAEFVKYTKMRLAYGWHISDIVIYDKQKDLSEFYHKCEKTPCEGCEHLKYKKVNSKERDWCCEYLNYQIPITRPPQSWCYVEELSV